jgi:hypothetical protein
MVSLFRKNTNFESLELLTRKIVSRTASRVCLTESLLFATRTPTNFTIDPDCIVVISMCCMPMLVWLLRV